MPGGSLCVETWRVLLPVHVGRPLCMWLRGQGARGPRESMRRKIVRVAKSRVRRGIAVPLIYEPIAHVPGQGRGTSGGRWGVAGFQRCHERAPP